MFDNMLQSTPAAFHVTVDSTFKTPGEKDEVKPLEKLNEFLQSRDISPVRHVMRSKWEDANERTKRRYVRETRQAITAFLEEVAPDQHHHLWKAIVSKPLDPQYSIKEQEDIDSVFMAALAQCYENASRWDTKRQILSVMVDKVSYSTLQRWIPELSRYRFTAARKHILVHGRGTPVASERRIRMAVPQDKLDHFLDFITSSHLMQDLPIGEKSITLSSKAVIKVPIM